MNHWGTDQTGLGRLQASTWTTSRTLGCPEGPKLHSSYTELQDGICNDYFYRIHNEEPEKILEKVTVVTPTYVEPVVKHQLPERTQLQEIMCDLSKGLNPHDIVMRQIHAIDTMVALSRRQEVQCHKSWLSKSSLGSSLGGSPKVKEESPVPKTFPVKCKETQSK
ncbi:hypothetical protein VC83_06341 [Pseudogymnoascus destructans]|uniref:Uncharacterized protein n=1 Tax=Pseudogymnoascus destructans TaxID=655981 RepID=A0A177AAJ5_9PEZI|nr:uncharacterized protein VC83_06341 [Pseudogymnoascus destructans]OAF58432.1 hypothetical protein VC83_06341 [Pseudogymnoascus destructans]